VHGQHHAVKVRDRSGIFGIGAIATSPATTMIDLRRWPSSIVFPVRLKPDSTSGPAEAGLYVFRSG
jgi:hypothetical protein